MTPKAPVVQERKPARNMNRDERRALRDRAISRLKHSRAYVLISLDQHNLPIYHMDLTACQDEGDVRNLVMQELANITCNRIDAAHNALLKVVKATETSEKVVEAKALRSAELAAALRGEKIVDGSAEVKADEPQTEDLV